MKKIIFAIIAVALTATTYAIATDKHHEPCCDESHAMNNPYQRNCPKHGLYDIRFGGCPACNAPIFGFR